MEILVRLLKKIVHPSLTKLSGRIFERRASRAIILDGEKILLLYTKRYNDYSFPGGGVSDEEDLESALRREVEEETGAQNIQILQEFGHVDEYRPHHKPEYDLIHMLSYFYVCKIDSNLGPAQMEHYEIDNGMEARWINIHEAISHNKEVISSKDPSMGFSIERETTVLEIVARELIETAPRCPLCQSNQSVLKLTKPTQERYWDCHVCGLIFLEKEFYLNSTLEEAHYKTHNNDISDERYQQFVSPIVNYVLNNLAPKSKGLDYGAGTGPVISALLLNKDYEMNLYDPFFWNDRSTLANLYNFIISCEVVEHFHSPAEEFNRFKNLLVQDGYVIIMTDLYNDSINFDKWYYHRDPTHVIFYRMETFEWIRKHFQFKDILKVNDRVVVLRS
jgi:ADP-ribose pyrophosphatase YjhB (NUDIX family)/transcription elongation factor Elf1